MRGENEGRGGRVKGRDGWSFEVSDFTSAYASASAPYSQPAMRVMMSQLIKCRRWMQIDILDLSSYSFFKTYYKKKLGKEGRKEGRKEEGRKEGKEYT